MTGRIKPGCTFCSLGQIASWTLALLLLCGLQICSAGEPVWIDTDPSIARGGFEADDGLALVQAFRSPDIEIRGISASFGDFPLEKTLPATEELTRRFGPSGLKVYEGAASAMDLGTETEASRALAIALRRERLTIVILGPATNVATVIELHPELGRRIKRVIAIAGRRPGQHFTPGSSRKSLRDANFELNPQAFHVLMKSNIPLTLIAWEAGMKILLSRPDLETHRPDPAIEWLYEPISGWITKWKTQFAADGVNPLDTLAIGYLTESRSAYKCDVLPVEIQRKADDTGPGPDKPYLQLGTGVRSKFKAEYCYDAGPGFKHDLLSKFGPNRP